MSKNINVSAAGLLIDAVNAFRAAREKAEGRGKKIIYELEKNHIQISNWEQSRIEITTIIANLSINTFEKVQHKFSSSDVKMRKITNKSVKGNTWHAHYVGWKSERLIRHIYKKILELKDIELNYPNDPKFRKSVRLINVNRLLKLLSSHLST